MGNPELDTHQLIGTSHPLDLRGTLRASSPSPSLPSPSIDTGITLNLPLNSATETLERTYNSIRESLDSAISRAQKLIAQKSDSAIDSYVRISSSLFQNSSPSSQLIGATHKLSAQRDSQLQLAGNLQAAAEEFDNLQLGYLPTTSALHNSSQPSLPIADALASHGNYEEAIATLMEVEQRFQGIERAVNSSAHYYQQANDAQNLSLYDAGNPLIAALNFLSAGGKISKAAIIAGKATAAGISLATGGLPAAFSALAWGAATSLGFTGLEELGHTLLGNKTPRDSLSDAAATLENDAKQAAIVTSTAGLGRFAISRAITAGAKTRDVAAAAVTTGAALAASSVAADMGYGALRHEREFDLQHDPIKIAIAAIFGGFSAATGFRFSERERAALTAGAQSFWHAIDGATDLGFAVSEQGVRHLVDPEEPFNASSISSTIGHIISTRGVARNAHLTQAARATTLEDIRSESSKFRERRRDPFPDPATDRVRREIGNVAEILGRRDIFRDSSLDEVAPSSTNYLHGSLRAIGRLVSLARNTTNDHQPLTLSYFEVGELSRANNTDHALGNKLVALFNRVQDQYWAEHSSESITFRGPNPASITLSPSLSPSQMETHLQAIQRQFQTAIRADTDLNSLGLSGNVRLGYTTVPAESLGSIKNRNDAKLLYYRALAEASAAAESCKKLNRTSQSFAELAKSSPSPEAAIISNYNFIPPETSPDSIFAIADQRILLEGEIAALLTEIRGNRVQQVWDATSGESEYGRLLRAGAKRLNVEIPQAPEDQDRLVVSESLQQASVLRDRQSPRHKSVRQALVKYLAMVDRPARFEGNAPKVFRGEQVPINSMGRMKALELGLIADEIPFIRADGDLDFLRDYFRHERASLTPDNLAARLAAADDTYGQFFERAATELRTFEERANRDIVEAVRKKLPETLKEFNADLRATLRLPDDTPELGLEIREDKGGLRRIEITQDIKGVEATAEIDALVKKLNRELEPIRIFIGKQSLSDEFSIVVAGRNATPDQIRHSNELARTAIRGVGLGKEFPRQNKITGETIAEGTTTATIATNYKLITSEADLESTIHENEGIQLLRKFIGNKNTSGDFSEITPEQGAQINSTIDAYLSHYESHQTEPSGIAALRNVTDLISRFENGNGNGKGTTELSRIGINLSEIKARITRIQGGSPG